MNAYTFGIAILLLLSGMAFLFPYGSAEEGMIEDPLAYTARGIIRIDGDSDFDSVHGVRYGSGTENDPYVISAWEIDASGKPAGIYIGNTSAYFRIENCAVRNAEWVFGFAYGSGGGIIVWKAANGTIRGGESDDNQYYGIYIYNSQNILVESATTNSNGNSGIYVKSSDVKILGNTLVDNGIRVENSDNAKIEGNDVSGQQAKGIYVSYSSNVMILNNTVDNSSSSGIDVYSVRYSTVHNNTITDSSHGIDVDSSIYTNTISNNTVSGGNYGIYLYLSRNAYLTGNEVRGMYGVYLASSSYNHILENHVSKSYEGIYLSRSPHVEVKNNTCRGDGSAFTRDGVYLDDSDSVTVSGNNCSYLVYGIFAQESTLGEIYGNVLWHNTRGFGASNSDNLTLDNNEFTGNSYGIYAQFINDTSVNGNEFIKNSHYGAYFIGNRVNVTSNTFMEGDSVGLETENSHDFRINRNDFTGNTIGMEIRASTHMYIRENNIDGNTYGVRVLSSNSVYMAYGHVANSTEGVNITSSSVNFHQVWFYQSDVGAVAYRASGVNFQYSSFYGNKVGILFEKSDNSRVLWVNSHNNTDAGIVFKFSDYIEIENSSITNNQGYGVWFVEKSNHTEIVDSEIRDNGKDGVYITGAYNSIIRCNISSNSYTGVYGYYANNLLLNWTEIYGNSMGGIETSNSDSIVINNSEIKGNMNHGLLLYLSHSYHGAEILNSVISNNDGDGAHFEEIWYFVVKNSTLYHNSRHGVYIDYLAYATVVNNTISYNAVGVCVDTSSRINLIGNAIAHNTNEGILINDTHGDYYHSASLYIEENLILENGGYGIAIMHPKATHIIIANNSFYYNNGATENYSASHVQAYDATSDSAYKNYWNTTAGGNFWCDWTAPDRNGDGFVDDPYEIDGGIAKDYLPGANPGIPIPELNGILLVFLVALVVYFVRRKK